MIEPASLVAPLPKSPSLCIVDDTATFREETQNSMATREENSIPPGGGLSSKGGQDWPQESLLVNTAVAAVLLNVSERKVTYLAGAGELPRVKVGRATRFSRQDIKAYIERNKD